MQLTRRPAAASPAAPSGAPPEGARLTGRITLISRARACGFIRATSGQEVFFHASNLDGSKFEDLEDRLAVRFTLVQDAVSGPRAVRVRIERPAARRAGRSTGTRRSA